MNERLFSPGQVAALTGRSTRTVRRWIAHGHLPVARLGRAVWVREADLLRALGLVEEPVPATQSIEKDDV